MDNITNLQKAIEEECKTILQKTNPYYFIPKKYSLVAEEIERNRELQYLLLPAQQILKNVSDIDLTCLSYFHDIGMILFNKSTKMICTDPQLLGKAMACFIFSKDHLDSLFQKTDTNSRCSVFETLSILTKVSFFCF